jgi:DNA-binding CsgD family transcriptional regulator
MLTNREIQVLNLISYGNTTKEIARDLYISYHTAEQHRKNIMKKMDAVNTAQMVRKGFETKVISIN